MTNSAPSLEQFLALDNVFILGKNLKVDDEVIPITTVKGQKEFFSSKTIEYKTIIAGFKLDDASKGLLFKALLQKVSPNKVPQSVEEVSVLIKSDSTRELDKLVVYKDQDGFYSSSTPITLFKNYVQYLKLHNRGVEIKESFLGDFFYNPNLPKSYFQDTKSGSNLFLNTYRLPEYRTLEPSSSPPDISLFKELLTSLISQDHVVQVTRWLAGTLRGKMNTALVLCGDKGKGKSLLVGTFLKELHGETNYAKAPDSFFKSDFSSTVVYGKTIVDIDEQTYNDRKAYNRFKSYLNNTIALERKGLDVEAVKDNFSNFVVSTNHPQDCWLELDDRRFLVPDLNPKGIGKVKGAQLVKLARNPEYIKAVYDYLMTFESLDPNEIIYSKNFYMIAEACLPEWFVKFIAFAKIKVSRGDTSFTISDLKTEFSDYRMFPRVQTFAATIRNTRLDEGRVKICEIIESYSDESGSPIVFRMTDEFIKYVKDLPEKRVLT